MTLCRPNFLSVNYPLITVKNRSRLHARQIAATIWFAKALAPTHFATQDFRQKLFFLLFSAPLQKCWTNKRVAKKVCSHRRTRVGKFFGKHHTFKSAQTLAAVFFWPGCTNPSACKQLVGPRIVKCFALSGGHFITFVKPTLRQVVFQPLAHFFSAGFGLGGVCQHDVSIVAFF